jgi:outer membrane protein assembly factor BamB
MRARLLTVAAVIATSGVLTASSSAAATAPRADVSAIPSLSASTAGEAKLEDWPEFGLDPQRSDVSERQTGITADNVVHLADRRLTLPGTVDSSPIYLHGATVDGATHDTIVVTTTYGRTIALDAASGSTLWIFTPAGFDRWAGSAQITTASPIADPDRKFVYAASPDGLIHKLSLANGKEDPSGAWPARITLDPQHEKIAAALNIDGSDVIATTGGYIGDVPPYQGHVALIARADGRLRSVFNTLCSDRRRLISTSSCSASDSAILSRAGAVVEPGDKRILIDTGNAPWNGTTDFGDSVLELSFPGLSLRQAFTPVNQGELNRNDTDLGSSAPALLGHNRVMVAGKDGIIRLLSLSSLNGHRAGSPTHRLGGEVQRLETPGGGELFSAPAVWQQAGRSTAFIADERGTATYSLRGGTLFKVWENNNAGTSPVMAGGLLYVYDQLAGGIYVYRPSSPQPLAKLPGEPGHWNSPIVVDGHVIEPEGNANEHSQTGTIEIFSGS